MRPWRTTSGRLRRGSGPPSGLSGGGSSTSSTLCMVWALWGALISGAEVAEVVKKLLGGRARVDEVRPEFLKTLDVVGLSWLTRLCTIALTSR